MFLYDTGKMDASQISPGWLGYFFAGAVQVQNYLYGTGENTCMTPVKREKN
jgi:hypothetical protein